MFSSNATQVSSANYIEDVFSTYLYTGNGSTQTITNGIDLAGKGGLVWIKNRSDTGGHRLFDTARGVYNWLSSNSTGAQQDASPYGVTAFNSNGFAVSDSGPYAVNDSGQTYASWTFREQPKFFDVVTYTGNGANRTISHNLGSTPAFMIVKSSSAIWDWACYHRSLGATKYLDLNTTDAAGTLSTVWNNTEPTSTVFSVGTQGRVNQNGQTYVAYLFAHNAGGFGLTGTDNVISCGSFTSDGSGLATINLGYEAQWVLIKNSGAVGDWEIYDTMRGMAYSSAYWLRANLSSIEANVGSNTVFPTATGFSYNGFAASQTGIYIAIRRGPMKVPTSGTSVFSPNTANASAGTPVVTNFPVDLSISVATAGDTRYFSDRLRGVNSTGQTANQPWIASNSTGAELTNASIPRGWDNTQILVPPYYAGGPVVWWNMRRAPSFFDEVCYTGTGNVGSDATRITHNLGVAPELIIVKGRTNAVGWPTYTATGGVNSLLLVNATDASSAITGIWATTAPTSTTFGVSNGGGTYNNGGGVNYVAYLFATCAGVSKVGSYTGTGTTLQVNCGFTGGARFVLIKRTDSTGDWYVWDSARGIVAGNDPYLLLNSTAAEVTNTDYVDTYSAGFEISSTAPAAINASGGTFIFLAIA